MLSLRPMISPSSSLAQIMMPGVRFVLLSGLQYNEIWIGCSHDVGASVAPVDIARPVIIVVHRSPSLLRLMVAFFPSGKVHSTVKDKAKRMSG